MSLKSGIVAQFRHPKGLLGALAGRVMATRPSNRIRNEKTVELMHLEPDSRVLEIGCGPGLALSRCAAAVTSGRLVGLDHSRVMIGQARRRLCRQGAGDRVELVEGEIERLADWPVAFDRIFSLNVIQFQKDKTGFYQAVSRALVPGGSCLTTYQPRLAAGGPGSADHVIETIETALTTNGFRNVARVEIIGGDAPAICVIGQKPEG